MTILTTDKVFEKRVAKVLTVGREDLWKVLHELAAFLALTGALEESLAIWRFAYGGLVPMPDPKDRTISAFGDGAVSAVCFQREIEDISKGCPPPRFAGRAGKIIVAGTLKKRVIELDQISRGRITADAWSNGPWERSKAPDLAAQAILRKARIKAQSSDGGKPSRNETLALSMLSNLIDGHPGFEKLHPCYRSEGLMLAADIAARSKKEGDAIRYLLMWHDVCVGWDYNVEEAFGLKPIARLICKNVLAEKHSLSVPLRREAVSKLVKDLTAQLGKPARLKKTARKHRLTSISHGQFYLEPREPDDSSVYFQVEGESEQQFSSFPCQVGFGTPDYDDECDVEIEFAKKVPPLGSAVQAVIVPLLVESTDGLYLRTVNDDSDKTRLQVPPDRYDVVARFFSHGTIKRRNSHQPKAYRVVLTFLPRGTATAKCLIRFGSKPPRKVVLNHA